MEKLKNVDFVLCETTSLCNIQCKYCYVSPDMDKKDVKMSPDIFKECLTLILDSTEKKEISIIYHGGEPFLMGKEWLNETAGFAIEEAKKRKKRIGLGLQTNGTLVNKEMIDLLLKYNISVGVSLDGPPEINDKMRHQGRKVMDNAMEMKRAGVNAGLLTVIGTHNYAHMRDVASFFRESGFDDMQASFMHNIGCGKEEEEMDTGKMIQACRDILNVMMETRGAFRENGLASRVIRYFYPRSKMNIKGCDEFYCQGGKNFISFDYFGDFYPCGLCTQERRFKMFNYKSPEKCKDYNKLGIHIKNREWAGCSSCSAQAICNYSCPFAALQSQQKTFDSADCEMTLLLWNFFREHENELALLFPILKEKLMWRKNSNPVLKGLDFDKGEFLESVLSSFNNPLVRELNKKKEHWFVNLGDDFYIHAINKDDIFQVEKEVYEELKAMTDPGTIEAALYEHVPG